MASPRPRRLSGSHQIGLLLVLLFGFGLRIVALEYMPPFTHDDEVNLAEYSLTVARGDAPWYGVRKDGDTNWAFLQYAPYALFGGNLWALRLTSALWSMLGLAATYYAVRQMFGASSAFYAAWLVAISHLLVHFGRAATIVILSITTSFLTIGLYLKAQRSQGHGLRRSALFVLVGAMLALNLYEYAAAKSVFFAIAALWLFSLPRHKAAWPAMLKDTACLTIGFGVVAAPILSWYIQRPVDLFSRMEFLSVFNPRYAGINLRLYGPVDTPTLLWLQTLRSVGAFFTVSDASPNYHFDAPLLDAPTAWLLAPGVVLAFRRNLSLAVVMLIWLAAGLIGGSILLVEPPTSYHYIVLVPLVIVFAALSLQWLAAMRLGRWGAPLLLVGISLLNVHLYFNVYPQKGAWYSVESDVGAYVRAQRDCCDVWYVGNPGFSPKRIATMVATPTPIRYVEESTHLPDTLGEDKPAIVIVPHDKVSKQMPNLKRRFPQGYEHDYVDRGYWMFRVYRLTRSQQRRHALGLPCLLP